MAVELRVRGINTLTQPVNQNPLQKGAHKVLQISPMAKAHTTVMTHVTSQPQTRQAGPPVRRA